MATTNDGAPAAGEVLTLPGDPGYAQLPAREKLRNVALSHFAELGMDGTTVRGVARAAGVSPSLLQYHFVTKDGLRSACDQYVAAQLRRAAELAAESSRTAGSGQADESRAVGSGRIADPDVLAVLYHTAPPVVQYLARALTDGSPAAARLFDHVVETMTEVLAGAGARPGTGSLADTRAAAAVYACMKLGVFVFHQQLTRLLGVDVLTPDNLNAVRAIMLDMFSGGSGRSALATNARRGIERFGDAAPPTR